MNQEILKRISQKKKRLAELRPLPQAVLKRLKSELSIEWTYNSNAIEGNTLSLKETRMVLEHGITIKGKNLREHFEVKNHEKAIFYVESLAKPKYKLSENDIFDIHQLVLENIESEFAGRYRNGQVRILGANFIPPNYLKISKLIKELIKSTNSNPDKLNIVELISRFHHQFVWIHPFFDGNGRTARLLMNLLFMKYGFPPAIILKNNREQYYRALNLANNGNYNSFILLIAQALERTLDLYLESSGILGKDEYVPLSILAKKFPYSQEYLSLLARTGKIDAHKRARNWLATETSIKNYLEKLKLQRN
jgi:Fic family protein